MVDRWVRVGAVVALVSVMLAVGAPAQALQGPVPEPVRFPGSTLKRSAPDLTQREWNRFLKQHPELRPVNAGNWTKVGLRGIGGVASAVFGLEMGLSAGTWVAGVVGLPTSGDFWCDLSTATTGGGCGLAADPIYVANSDITAQEEGWITTSANYLEFQPTVAFRYWDNVLVSAHVTSEVPIGVPGPVTFAGLLQSEGTVVQPTSNTNGPNPIPHHIIVEGITSLGTSSSICSATVQVDPSLGSQGWTCSGEMFEQFVWYVIRVVSSNSSSYAPNIVMTWVPQGHPEWQPGQDANPETWWRTTWRCDAAAPQVRESPTFREGDANWPSMPVAECDPGAVVTSILIEQMTAQGVRDTIVDWELDQAGIDWQEDHGHCIAGDCELLLWRIDPQTDKLLNCFQNPELCYDWFRAPNRANQYQCTYGGTVVDLRECYVYKRIFRDRVYADPDPDDETDPDPVPDPTPPPNPELPPRRDDDNNCPPPFEWHSVINPWWHYKSFVCGLQDMFVPRTAPKWQRVNDAINGSAVGQVATVWGDPMGFGGQLFDPSAMSCGVLVDHPVDVLGGQRVVVDTCEGIWQQAGGARTVLGVAFIAAGALGGIWVLLGTVRIRPSTEGTSA